MPESDQRRRSTPRTLLIALLCGAVLAPGAAVASAQQAPDAATEPPAAAQPQTDAPETGADAGTDAGAEASEAGAEDAETEAESTPTEPEAEASAADDDADVVAAKPRLRLKLERSSSQKIFYNGKRTTEFTLKIAGSSRRDLRVQAIRKSDRKIVRGWRLDNVQPDKRESVRWGGATRRGEAVSGGRYYFRVREQDGPSAERRGAEGNRGVSVQQHMFPVRGRHSYGDGFGAGRGHQGADVFAPCGTKMVAARAGRVQYRGYQSSAGNYIVIDGRGTSRDYVYMHLKRPARFGAGRKVKTGQMIGVVGETGNASGCHLHMEVWNGGWYEGGRPSRKIKSLLKSWDSWS